MKHRWQFLPGIVLLALAAAPLVAQVNIPNIFQPGETARAAQVNANFEAMQVALEALQEEVGTLASELEDARARLDDLAESDVMQLSGFIEVYPVAALVPDDTGTRGPLIRFTGANVQVVDGTSGINPTSGLGNLVVGYDLPRNIGRYVCSQGNFDKQDACETAGHLWARDHKSGSHNLVLGFRNAYSQSYGMVSGIYNVSNSTASMVTGGWDNIASGAYSTVTGGLGNTAAGESATVAGGVGNTATGRFASVTGGYLNTAAGERSSVTGGGNNVASGYGSAVTGGGGLGTADGNTAANVFSSILGGIGQTTSVDGQAIPPIP